MSGHAELVHLNGQIVPIGEARVGILDRGFLFGDGVYELIRFFDRVGVGMDLHVRRLESSLRLSRITGFEAHTLPAICDEVLAANDLHDASVYVQITRGSAPLRAHIPPAGLRPTVMAIASPSPGVESLVAPDRIRAVLLPDERWLRCEIKTISLMGNVLAAMAAADRGADEAILHRDGILSEGGSTNVFLCLRGTLVTPAITDRPPILHGVSRAQVIDAARGEGVPVEERRVSVDELAAAEEIMVTSSRRLLSSVVELDGRPLRGGSMAQRLFDLMRPRLHSAS